MFALNGALRVADFAVILFAAILAHALYLAGDAVHAAAWQYYYLAGLVGALLGAIVFHLRGGYVYKPQQVPFGRLRIAHLCIGWCSVILTLIVLAYACHVSESYSRGWMALWFSFAMLGMTAIRIVRWAVERHFLRQGKLTRQVVVYGSGENAARLFETLRTSQDMTFRVLGYFDERRKEERWHPRLEPEIYLGCIKDVIAYGRQHRVDQVVIALPWTAEKRIIDICKKLRSLPVDIQLAPDFVGFHLLYSTYSHLGGVTVLNVFAKPLTDWHYIVKAVEDRVLALLMLGVAWPLLAVIALAVRLDSRGPILFRQKRYGFNNKLIKVYKFRTMYAEMTDVNACKLATRNDPRVTRVGRFLRKSSLDELPQLLNVLKGDMSIVGPRPHAMDAKAADRLYEEVVDEYAARHRVKPGITGWAQVKGWRGETDTEEKIQKRVEHDLYYIEHWSLALDLKILLMTVRALLRAENAY